jgi:malate dehydrogenase (oxaloacetate-decarboxylating)(NADP+)
MFGVEPVIMVSFSNFGSSSSPKVSKVRGSSLFTHEHHPDLIIDGEVKLTLNQKC